MGLGAGFALALSLPPFTVPLVAGALLGVGSAIAAADLLFMRITAVHRRRSAAARAVGRPSPDHELSLLTGQVFLIIAADPLQRRHAVEDLLALNDHADERESGGKSTGGRILVPSRPLLLSGTLRENLRLSAPNVADATLASALAASQAPSSDQRLCDCLDLSLHPPKNALATADLRALSFARALARRPRLILVEEGEAGLSAPDRRHFDRLIRTLAHHCSVILIASAPPADWDLRPEATLTLGAETLTLRARLPAD